MAKRRKRSRRHRHPTTVFAERDPSDLAEYQDARLGDDLTRSELVDSMERLLMFTRGVGYEWKTENDLTALIYATVVRSARTFEGICMLLRSGLAVQAAMLCRSLFEDVVVGHWLYLNGDDPDWLVGRFLRQREAIGLQQRELMSQTGAAAVGPPIPIADDAASRARALRDEFGAEVSKDWWNPGREGEGRGSPVKLRKIVGILEDKAAKREMFHPRFAGGEAALLRTTERVINKWFNQCTHHTVIGLPFAPSEKGTIEVPTDPMPMVCNHSTWLFAQQVYLAHDVANLGGKEFEATFWGFMLDFSTAIKASGAHVEKLEQQLAQMLAELSWDDDDGTAS